MKQEEQEKCTDSAREIAHSAPETRYAAKRIEYDDAGNITYFGTSVASAKETDELWRIEKLEYSTQGITRNYFPKSKTGEPNSFYNFKWSNRANYEYA